MDRKLEIYTRGPAESEWAFLAYGRLTDMYDIHEAGPLPHWVTRELSRSLWAHQTQTFVELTLGRTQYRVEVGPPIAKDFFQGCQGFRFGPRTTEACEVCGSVLECMEYAAEAEGVFINGVVCGSCYAYAELDRLLHRDDAERGES